MYHARHADQLYGAARPSAGRGCAPAFLLAPLTVLVFAAGMLTISPAIPDLRARTQTPAASATAIAPVFTPQVQYWNAAILRWAAQTGLDPDLLAVIMQIESCGNPGAQSRAGALGLFQVMPYHFLPGDDPYSPDTNAARGVAYLRRALAASAGDVRLALAGYNGGISRISQPEWSWPAETIRYAYWGSGIYADAVSGAETSARLAEWFSAGGSSLCSRAAAVLAP